MRTKQTLAELIAERNGLLILVTRRALRPTAATLRRLDKLNEMIEHKELHDD